MMFGDFLSNRWVQAGLIFFVLCVGGSLLYSWHVRRTTVAELVQSDLLLQDHGTQDETSPAVKTVDTSRVNFDETPLEKQSAVPKADDTGVFPSDTALPIDLSDTFLPETSVSEEAPFTEEIPVSPYGFGPYPEVPSGYPLPDSIPWEWTEEHIAGLEETMRRPLQEKGVSFTEFLKTNELMARVGIKFFNEGRSFDGIITSDKTGLFYPNEPDVLYVKWREMTLPNGDVKRYMSQTIGSAISNISIAAQEGREPPPDGIEIRSLNDGIVPYDFLGLSR